MSVYMENDTEGADKTTWFLLVSTGLALVLQVDSSNMSGLFG